MATRASREDLSAQDARLARYTLLTHLLDQVFRIPGTRWRFGLDAIIGLVPGAGDAAGALLGLYGIWVARRLGAPASIQLRMLGNLGVDGLIGAIPLLGDLFDFAFKSHVRNRVLLEKWLVSPHATARGSRALLIGIPLAALGLLAAILWLAVASLSWLATALRS